MSEGLTFFAVVAGGLGALLGPSMPLVGWALLVGGITAGSRAPGPRALLLTGTVFALAVAAVWVRADLVPSARFSHWFALVPLLGLAEIRRLRLGWEDWMGPAIALCTAGLVLFWRVDRYGPVLSTLRGDWQQPLTLHPRWIYHLSTAVGLAVVLGLIILVVGRLPGRARRVLAWVALGLTAVLVVFDLVAPLQHWLLMRGLPWRVG